MATIFVDISGVKDLERKLANYKKKNSAREICRENAQDLVQMMKSIVPYWHGNLMKSIQSRQTIDGYNIHMNFYGRFLEEGHMIPKGATHPFLRLWAMEKLGEGLYGNWAGRWLGIIKSRGWKVQAQPFIRPAVAAVTANLPYKSIKIVVKNLKECGFNER